MDMNQNPEPEANPEKKIPLVELFGPTIQGEGAVIGQQTFFLRFGLCDFKCKMCDSMHAVNPIQVKQNAMWLTQEEIFNALVNYREDHAPRGTKWVTFSGGNPCIHDLYQLVINLQSDKWKIAVETQGTLYHPWIAQTDIVTVSPKSPGMGERCELPVLDKFIQNYKLNRYQNGRIDALNLKIVVFSQQDLEFAKMIFERYEQDEIPFYLSLGNSWPPGFHSHDPLPPAPKYSNTDPEHIERLVTIYRQLFEDIQNDPVLSKVRFLPQWHVFVWGNAKGR